MDKYTLEETVIFHAKTINIDVGTKIKIEVKLFDETFNPKKSSKNQKALAVKEFEKTVQTKDQVIEQKVSTIRTFAESLGVDPEKVKYVSGWIDANNDGDVTITREYDEEVAIEVENKKKKLHFIFYTLTGSKNDSIFVEQVNLREKTIENTKEYNDKIDIIYIKEVKKSSEILSYVKNKIEENGGQEEIEVKTIELFAELFKEKKKKEKDDSSIDTSNHWLNNMAQPHIPDGVSVDEARNVINDNVKRKEYLNEIYETNQERFEEELKAGTIKGLGYVETFCTVAFLASPPIPHAKVFFAFVGASSNFVKSRLEKDEDIVYVTKLGLSTVFDTIVDGDKRLSIANELFVKPYLTYIIDNISKDKIEKRNR